MSWIETIAPEDATGKLAEHYDRIGSARGGVAAVHQAQSLHPRAMMAHLDLYKSVMLAPSALDRTLRELIAVVVSAANECAYCVRHHAEAALQAGVAVEIVTLLAAGESSPSISEKERVLLRWAWDMTEEPSSNDDSRIDELRVVGWNDREILDATLVISYFNFVNRIVLGLGVELEADFEAMCG